MSDGNDITIHPSQSQTLIFHFFGMPVAFLLSGYLSNFYSGFVQFIFISIISQLFCGVGSHFLLTDVFEKFKKSWRDVWISLAALIVVVALAIASVVISWQYPGLFDARIVFMDMNQIPIFVGMAVISIAGSVHLMGKMEQSGMMMSLKTSRPIRFMQTNLPGIFVSNLFFFTYFIFAQSLNFPGHYTVDQYFETDISEWISRLTLHPMAKMPTIRAVHPAVMLFLRPPLWLITILLKGDQLQAVYFLSALAGASCVFLIWLIIKGNTGNTTYALIIASILGASTSHLLLSSMLETYIYSALALIVFCFLMQSGKTSLRYTVPMGIVIFGITITNLAQACILYLPKAPRIKTIIQFIIAVFAFVLLLNILQVRFFPSAKPLYDPTSLHIERAYKYELFETHWKLTGRVNLIARSVLLYGVVAPRPYILSEELGVTVPNFRTFRIAIDEIQVAGYRGMGDITVKTWIAILGLAIVLFMMIFIKSPKQITFPVSLILCMAFSFCLHLFYGDDPMLYSPNWVYALILFVSSSYEKWANNKYLQIGLIIFLGMILYTNLSLMDQIMRVALPFYGK